MRSHLQQEAEVQKKQGKYKQLKPDNQLCIVQLQRMYKCAHAMHCYLEDGEKINRGRQTFPVLNCKWVAYYGHHG